MKLNRIGDYVIKRSAMEHVCVSDSWNIGKISYAWQWKWTGIAVTEDNSWMVIGISAVSGDVASQEYVRNAISGCRDEQVSSVHLAFGPCGMFFLCFLFIY